MTGVLLALAVAATAGGSVEVSFKLDPRLTRGLYMGDRWVSPPTYAPVTQSTTPVAIEARAHRVRPGGGQARISPPWTPSDTEMVRVSPAEGHQVTITVHRPGESTLAVGTGEDAVTLVVRAVERDGAIKVEVSRKRP